MCEVTSMSEAKTGNEFITHELDEAIAVQRAIVKAEQSLSKEHPSATAKRALKQSLKEDEGYLRQLETLGRRWGATGKAEDVAKALGELMSETSEKAAEAESEAYEAHAVLLNLKRKQQDSGSAMLKIARAMKDTEMRDAAREFASATKASAQVLATELAEFAVTIATADGNGKRSTKGQGARASA
jgi:hypothetical protein